ncbi:AB hydrolase superfamily protein [Tolypocladium ophioglossoides CBS 100239]|uniref:AB hydrolase superfamily protein n=1 Tax=Tolypocladium ophioglossoides (strain CBS 100239) TaxID=1163406 RepID=A0A0L0N9P2_TOLOC|nr:AB hydrolase superfamily protein [Tolypocladium ophioglossoides CBS 100239]
MPTPPYPLHPSVVDRLDPQCKALYNEHIIHQQQVHYQPLEASRASGVLLPGAGPLVPVGKTADHAIRRRESAGPDVAARCFTPDGPAPAPGWPVLVYFPGGGWVIGNIDTENAVATNICARGRCVVVSVDFRLAPENPFPAAVDDAWEAVLWVLGPGEDTLHLDTSKMAVGGSSAGGNLAAVVCQRAAARGSPVFRLQLQSAPVLDNTADTTNNASYAENEHAPALPAAKMLWYRDLYLPDQRQRSHPEASPLLWPGDWSALPPAVIVLGELDVLRHEGELFGRKLADAGVRADVHVLKGQPHSFLATAGALEDGRRAVTWFCDGMLSAMYGS